MRGRKVKVSATGERPADRKRDVEEKSVGVGDRREMHKTQRERVDV